MTKLLLLGGTTEASRLAMAVAEAWGGAGPGAGRQAVFSYAGRTARPASQPLPCRIGGFGGVAGLVAYLRREAITHVVDATHPFAAQMSANAVAACEEAGVKLLGYERPEWIARPGDRWIRVADMAAAVAALPEAGARVFLAIGKQHLSAFSTRPGNHYLLRLVDAPVAPLPLADSCVVVARGPFDAAGDEELMRSHAITHVVAKNAGGSGAQAKLVAARALGLPVVMMDRPRIPSRQVRGSVAEVMSWLDHA
ncbi:cobalt-precorrin-6A reductase [Phaeobacter sp. B1627]|uniref:cobalt-precorrin-6A reductase n=1 Tax=Phaeobacter sp. B1627 TaxID=2583809 RepID=UPI001119C4A8|nr:cobalt-precorrin-6A reductase [Phaeobacter sp. B1627]TNJ41295.1 cobalt-precorrin-6A reductase [Phaeobacter sp. B1627]